MGATVSVRFTREGCVACCASSLAYHSEHLPDRVQMSEGENHDSSGSLLMILATASSS